MTRILIADDHLIILDGIKEFLKAEDDIVIAGVANNGKEVLDLLSKIQVDLLLMDINMPVMDGFSCAKKVKEQYPEVKILLLTMYSQKSIVTRMVEMGVHGCFMKSNGAQELLTAIKRVVEGKNYFDTLTDFEHQEQKLKEHRLGSRELEVIVGICEGMTSKEISEKLCLSNHTVRTHRKNIFRKVGVHDSAALIRFAIENGMV